MSRLIDHNYSFRLSQERGISLDHKRFLTLKPDTSNNKYNDSNRYITETQREHFMTEHPVKNAKFHSLSPIHNRRENNLLSALKPSEYHSTKTLILDLDETLIHSSFNRFALEADILLKVKLF